MDNRGKIGAVGSIFTRLNETTVVAYRKIGENGKWKTVGRIFAIANYTIVCEFYFIPLAWREDKRMSIDIPPVRYISTLIK